MPKGFIEVGPNQAYAGVVQLRCPVHARLEAALDYVRTKAGAAGISKIARSKGGYDVYIVEKRVLQSVARQLQKRFGGSISTSLKLVTQDRQTSKRVYRKIIAFHMFPFAPGEVIIFNNAPVLVTAASLRVHGLNLATGKRTSFVYQPGTRMERLQIMTAHVSQFRPVLKLIHPITFQPVEPENLKSSTGSSL